MTPDVVPAAWFLDRSIGVFPLKTRSKEPACSSWDDFTCSREQASRFVNYGVRLSTTLGALDTDDPDDEYWVLQQIAQRVLCDTPFVVTTARGKHRYFRLDGPLPKSIRRDGHVIEFRNAGQYVVGPGSVHPSGATYTAADWSWRWETIPHFPSNFVFDDGSCPQAPAGLDGGPFVLPEVIIKKWRHDTLHKLMRALVAHGVPLDGALKVCLIENKAKCHPALTDLDELDGFLRRAYKQKDRADFVRAPKTGWLLAGTLLEVGLSVDATLVAVRSVDPTFDPEVSE